MKVLLALALLLAVSGCGSGSAKEPGADTTLTVLAASSLTEVFTDLGQAFEAAHPGVHVRFAFDSSATLADQAAQGAPADVLATADLATMADATDAGVVPAEPRVFARNTLVLAVPADNPAHLTSFADLDRPGTAYVVCVETAPCGTLAARALRTEQVMNPPKSLEVDVKAVLARVTEGEADAGLVYSTDAVAAGAAVTSFPVPHAEDFPTVYPIAALRQSAHPALARAWLDFVLSAEGQRVLADAGFGSP